jgi:DNA modification methylase
MRDSAGEAASGRSKGAGFAIALFCGYADPKKPRQNTEYRLFPGRPIRGAIPLKTTHRLFHKDARRMAEIPAESVHLVVTSPPYPMIEMWDDTFKNQDPEIGRLLQKADGPAAFRRMHEILDPVWAEIHRVLTAGGIAAVNIGDAVRTLDDRFALYPNHARILSQLMQRGFSPLPLILWRKQTNAPNKFMGSGMLPPGAYVTLEHEYVLIVRKGNKRRFFSAEEKARRRESAFFREERNRWFSDVWTDLKGTGQTLVDSKTRKRSAAFPFELAYRLIHMFSVAGDAVLDPFLGTGTTMWAAAAGARNSLGFEIDAAFGEAVRAGFSDLQTLANERNRRRLQAHAAFMEARRLEKGEAKYINRNYGFPVVTRQEVDIRIPGILSITQTEDAAFEIAHSTDDGLAKTQTDG